MDPASLLLFGGALALAAGSPGPSIAALVARVLSRGRGDVLPFLAAMWVGEAIWLSFAAWGLAAVAQTFHLAFVVIKWLGVLYLLLLAWRMWTAPAVSGDATEPEPDGRGRLFWAGFAVTLGNPKIMLFYIALLPAIVDLDGLTVGGWLQLVGVMAAVLIAVDGAWVLLADAARRLLRSGRATKIVNRLCAGVMAGAASAIATR